jgi:predicted dinucleotide-binding enzyme
MSTRIAIVGAGNLGRTLGAGWLRAGHQVTFGVRDPAAEAAQQTRAALGPAVQVLPIPAALEAAAVVVLALPGSAVDDFLAASGSLLANKVIVDAANRAFGGSGPMNSVDAIRARADPAGIVRAFNSVGWENLANPVFDGVVADLLYCATPAARAVAEELIAGVGLRPVLVGDLDQVQLMDALSGLWAALAYGQRRGRHLAFNVHERTTGADGMKKPRPCGLSFRLYLIERRARCR